ncbi:hypothetical protein LTR17_026543, partial [Elasticomyces elasticus]
NIIPTSSSTWPDGRHTRTALSYTAQPAHDRAASAARRTTVDLANYQNSRRGLPESAHQHRLRASCRARQERGRPKHHIKEDATGRRRTSPFVCVQPATV